MTISRRTCLVLGAGASTHAGYYVGQNFKQAITNLEDDAGFLKIAANQGLTNVSDFLDRFRHSACPSPDRFLEDHPEYINAGKYCIAHALANCEDDRRVFPGAHSDWYDTLWNALEIESPDYLREQLSVVTFNYDRSLEYYIWKVINSRCGDKTDEAKQLWEARPEILHVHGLLGEFDPLDPEFTRQYRHPVAPEEVAAAAGFIHIISEQDLDDDLYDEFRHAKGLLENADDIFFLGFGYDSRNVARLRVFSDAEHCAKVRGTAVGMESRHVSYIVDVVFQGMIDRRVLDGSTISDFLERNLSCHGPT